MRAWKEERGCFTIIAGYNDCIERQEEKSMEIFNFFTGQISSANLKIPFQHRLCPRETHHLLFSASVKHGVPGPCSFRLATIVHVNSGQHLSLSGKLAD
jgi:hypothetical protein